LVARCSKQGARWHSCGLDRAAPPGLVRHLGGAPPWPRVGGVDPQRLVRPDGWLREAGHAQERRWLAQGLPHVREEPLWIDERPLCPLGLLLGRARRGAAFVVRQHGQGQGARRGRLTRKGASRCGPVSARVYS
jgi:hypothetical protein